MAADTRKLRVLIPTTNGPVEVLLLTEEDAAIGRCVACIGGTTETADIAADYHAFVVRPTGVIETLFGHPCYRLDVSGRIDAGSSWQLGVFAAHALHAAGRLAEENDPADGVLWATGSVRAVDLTVGPVGHIPEKITSSLDRLRQEAAAGRDVLVMIPADNASAVSTNLKAEAVANSIEVGEIAAVQQLCERLGVKVPEQVRRSPAVRPPPAESRRLTPLRKLLTWGAGAILFATAAGAIYLFARVAGPVADREPPLAQRATEVLAPETMPFISDRDRAAIRGVYMPASEHKALAVGADRMGFSTAQPDADAARLAAIAACEIAAQQARGGQCELYAIGNNVVLKWPRPPMPQQPWIIRDPLVETPFAPADVPMRNPAVNQGQYANARTPKAMALSPSGLAYFYSGAGSVDEAVRRSLERCGMASGAACMIIAVDNSFVVPIPRSMKVVGVSRPDAVNVIAPEIRSQVAQRLGNSTKGWNAVAVGVSGRVGVALEAETEVAAIEGAMADCRRNDRDCNVILLGPFRVERAAALGK